MHYPERPTWNSVEVIVSLSSRLRMTNVFFFFWQLLKRQLKGHLSNTLHQPAAWLFVIITFSAVYLKCFCFGSQIVPLRSLCVILTVLKWTDSFLGSTQSKICFLSSSYIMHITKSCRSVPTVLVARKMEADATWLFSLIHPGQWPIPGARGVLFFHYTPIHAFPQRHLHW